MSGRDDAIHTGVSDRDGRTPMTTTPLTPEVGITYLCDLRGAGKKRNLLFLPYADGDRCPWFGLDGGGVFYHDTDVTPIRPVTQRIPDEGGNWERCSFGRYSDAVARRMTENENETVYERWIPDAPPVTVPTEPTYGIASGTTSGLTEFTDALCRVINAGSIRVDLPDGDTGYVFREQIDRITAWRTIPAPGSES